MDLLRRSAVLCPRRALQCSSPCPPSTAAFSRPSSLPGRIDRAAAWQRTGVSASATSKASPTIAEIARTVVEVVHEGTLVTLGDDGTPIGTYTTFVLDAEGRPILRLRTEALHTQNLQRSARCSVFVHPRERPARLLARVTLIGEVQPVSDDEYPTYAARHEKLSEGALGVDKPDPSDLFYKLEVERCLFVGGLGQKATAETVSFEEYKEAEPDLLRNVVPKMTVQWNTNRQEELQWIAAAAVGCRMQDIMFCNLLWVDRLGAYIETATIDKPSPQVLRVGFDRSVQDERDALSMLTMMARTAWQDERAPAASTNPSPPANPTA